MKYYLLLVSLIFSYLLTAQNLVKNPSFESTKRDPWDYGEFNNNVHYWSSPNTGTPDLFCGRCHRSKMSVKNYRGIQEPKSGEMYAGAYFYAVRDGKDYREYIQNELKQTLQKDYTYTISFYLSLAEYATHRINEMHVVFSSDKLGPKHGVSAVFNQAVNTQDLSFGILDFQDVNHHSIVSVDISSQKFLMNDWVKVSTVYKAKGFERFLSIGNMTSNEHTKTVAYNPVEDRPYAYYYIDEVTIESNTPIEFQPKMVYRFKNVFFDFDKAILLKRSTEELDKLFQHLEDNPTLHIEIYGHTDNVGLEARNQELSQQRAEAVANYLISKGINANRIKHLGFGAKVPLVENSSEENRAINRRVEFKLISN